MAENLYGGISYPNTSFIFDKVYPSYNEAQAALIKTGEDKDQVLIGRYVLVAYCEQALKQDVRNHIEALANSNAPNPYPTTTSEYNYFQNFIADGKVSYDRMVLRKVYKDNVYAYQPIASLNSTLSDESITVRGVQNQNAQQILHLASDGSGILSTELHIMTATHDGSTYIQLVGTNGIISEIDADDFIADGVLGNIEFKQDTNELLFTWNVWDATNDKYIPKTKSINLDDILQPYIAGNGITISNTTGAKDAKINIQIDSNSEKFLSVDASGLKLSGIQNALDAVKNQVKQANSYSGLGSGTNIGDIGIVTTSITTDKTSYTAYVWNGTAWAAMDGNYNAANVYLDSNLIVEGAFASIGNYEKGTEIAAGTSLDVILSNMLQKELYPTANDKPSAAITASGGNGEVGSAYTVPTATLTITDVGSYEYGDKSTGIVFATNNVKLAEGAEPSTATNYVQNIEPMVQGQTITLKATGDQALYTDAGTSYTFSGIASYPAGKVPVTNLNNAYPAAQIPAGSVTIADKTVTFIGYRYGFAGGANATTINSSVVRGMAAKKKAKTEMDAQSKALEFTAHKGDTKIFFAYPATWSGTPHFEIFGLAWGTINDFVAKTNIQVADARGGSQGTTAYKLYVWEPKGGALTADETKFRVWFE